MVILIVQCKTAVSPVCWQRRYCSLASHVLGCSFIGIAFLDIPEILVGSGQTKKYISYTLQTEYWVMGHRYSWTIFTNDINCMSICTCNDIIMPVPHVCVTSWYRFPDSKVEVAHMGPTWVLSAPDGPHVGPMNLAIREVTISLATRVKWVTDILFVSSQSMQYCARNKMI